MPLYAAAEWCTGSLRDSVECSLGLPVTLQQQQLSSIGVAAQGELAC